MRWRPYPVAIFDCDSTLSTVEGIDELAVVSGSLEKVAELTDSAMDGNAPLEDVYGKRLEIVNPSREQVRAVRDRYKATVVPDAKEIISVINTVGYESWVVSGGLEEPVKEFATWLGVEPSRVHAVGAEFDPLEGQWWNQTNPTASYAGHQTSGLSTSTGNSAVITRHINSDRRRLLVGDGVSDFEASDHVDLFVAYAGVVDRPAVTKNARVVIKSLSLAPLLVLILGPEHVAELLGGEHNDWPAAA